MKNILLTAIIVSTMTLSTAAEAGRRHHHGAGMALGIMGAIIGGAIIADQINRERRSRRNDYRRVSYRCAERWGWHTRKWERCMIRHGY